MSLPTLKLISTSGMLANAKTDFLSLLEQAFIFPIRAHAVSQEP